jgi:phosphate starvation-inducible PhoH-like protein
MSRKKTEEIAPKLQERIKPKTKGQAQYLRTLVENTVTFVTGDAGTGKSFLALGLAAEYLLEGRYDTLIVARPAVEASKKGLGFLPGNLDEKLDPYVLPAIKHLKRH